MTYDLDHAQETFRLAVLKALDEAASEVFGGKELGATDADLPHIFPTIDEHLLRLSERFHHPLYEGFVGGDAWHRDRAALRALGKEVCEDDAAPGQ